MLMLITSHEGNASAAKMSRSATYHKQQQQQQKEEEGSEGSKK
jgi:hypothetical protein